MLAGFPTAVCGVSLEVCLHDELTLAGTQTWRSLYIMSEESNHGTQGICAVPTRVTMLIHFHQRLPDKAGQYIWVSINITSQGLLGNNVS